jgi:CMP/dCMP kinase
MIVAIDGPAGAGKSTVCRLLAQKLGYVYLDTGAMYRAAAWAMLQENFTFEDESEITRQLPSLSLRFTIDEDNLVICYRGRRLGEELRGPEISEAASRISQIASVRTYLTYWQRQVAAKGSVVAEGRDMSTVVFPKAQVKIFLTADLTTRAKRREAEYRQKGIPFDIAELESQIRARDEADSKRLISPLRPAPGALVLDTSKMSISDVVDRLIKIVSEAAQQQQK